MRPLRALLLIGSLVSCYSLAHAGAEVMAEFRDERGRTPEVLAHVPLKAVVAEFLDPLDTGLGKSLGYLLWRETLTAISDQAGAGVIVAEAPPEERLVDMLKRDYHRAALRIAKHQRARMSLWGAVEAEAGEVFINTYLSVLTKETQGDLRFALDKRFRGDAALRERMALGVSKGAALEEMRALSAQAQALKQQQSQSTQRMGRRPRGFTLFSFLDGLAGKTQLKGNIDYMKPSTKEPKGSPHKVSVVEMKLVGINMAQLMSYLYRIETSANLVEIKRLAITKTDKKAGFINAVLQVETPQV